MGNKLYVKSPIDANEIIAGKPYEVIDIIEDDLSFVRIQFNDRFKSSVLTEKSFFNCSHLDMKHKWQFCDENGNTI